MNMETGKYNGHTYEIKEEFDGTYSVYIPKGFKVNGRWASVNLSDFDTMEEAHEAAKAQIGNGR